MRSPQLEHQWRPHGKSVLPPVSGDKTSLLLLLDGQCHTEESGLHRHSEVTRPSPHNSVDGAHMGHNNEGFLHLPARGKLPP